MAFSPVLMASLRLPRPCHTHVVLQRYCEQEAHRYPDGDLMSQAKILEFSVWLVDVECSRMVLATHSAAWGERPLHCCV